MSRDVHDSSEGWTVEWCGSLAGGKRVTLRNRHTGETGTGHDWNDWDRAFRQAFANARKRSDLISEIEAYLRWR